MNTTGTDKNNRQVAIWLLIGVGMIIIQVLLGGITRLTESGLSITEWKPITGTLPPMNETAWQTEFDKYRTTDQFKYVHQHFSLKEFKSIFFWEWAHRLWARLMGLVFLIGFIYFAVRKKFNKGMIGPMIFLFLLGALQGVIGWLMVKSGLVPEKYFVGHIELTTHFIAALILLAYTCWFAMGLIPAMQHKVNNTLLKKILIFIFILLFFQLIYGGFMAGLRAGAVASTWPDINGDFIPSAINEMTPWQQNLINNKLAIHFIHRGLAYLLLGMVIVYFFKSGNIIDNRIFSKLRIFLLALILSQVILGISTVLYAANPEKLVWLGVMHQFTAMMLVICMTALIFIVEKNK